MPKSNKQPAEFKVEPCKYCGKGIVWAKSDEDKWIPLDPKPSVYNLYTDENTSGPPTAVRDRCSLVNHYATCTKLPRDKGSK